MYPGETQMSKEVGIRIRVDEQLRREFTEACKSQDLTASQVLRNFMRAYVEKTLPSVRQNNLFGNYESPVG